MKKILLSLVLATVYSLAIAAPGIFTPEQVAPANNQTGVAPNVELDWTPVVGLAGLYYVLHLSTDEAFTSPVELITDLSSYRTAQLMFGTDYYWKVKAVDPSGSSDWSAVRKFTTVVRPVIRRPNINATVDANVEVQWDAIAGVSHYDFQFDTTNQFNSPELLTFTVSGTANKGNAANLLFGETYFLRLRARHAQDNSDWSDVRSVVITTVFALSKPDNAANGMVPDVELQWTEVKGVSKYNIYISTDPDFHHFETYIAQGSVRRTKPDTLNFGTQYYWKMAAIHAKDTLDSNQRSFTTLDNVTLVAPENNATNIVLQPSLTWNKISGVKSYELQLARNSNFTGTGTYNYYPVATSGTGNEQFKVPINVLDSAGVYYWRVRAVSSRDTTQWGSTWNFRTVTLSIGDQDINNAISIYPTPAKDQINVKLGKNISSSTAEVKVYDLLGKVRIERLVIVDNGTINNFALGNLPDGIYLVHVRINEKSMIARVVVQQ
ncbi:MAG: T9SS type A sorting domain-containing protein [Lentimicrobium sp.]|nr:T9SS type A sorting domain-containing protein [Lentimicrobium sp.]